MTHLYKKIFLTTALASSFATGALAAGSDKPAGSHSDANVTGIHTISVSIDNIENPQGYVMAALFNSDGTWLGKKPVRAERIEVTSTEVSFIYQNLPAGNYAISVFHDVDGDGELNTGLLGIPTEPYGFSNNAPVRFGPPKWEASKFMIGNGVSVQSIRLKQKTAKTPK